MALLVHQLPVRRGGNTTEGVDSPCAPRRPQASTGPVFSPPCPTSSPRDLGTQGREADLPGGGCMGGAPFQDVPHFSSVSFPIPGRGEAGGASTVPTLGHHPTWAPGISGAALLSQEHGRGEAGLWLRAAGTGLSLSLSHTHLGLVSMLMYLRSSAAYWAICSGVASSPGYTGSSGAPRVPSGGCSNRATQADRSSRKRQRQAAGIWGARSRKVRKDRAHLPGPLAHHPCLQAWGQRDRAKGCSNVTTHLPDTTLESTDRPPATSESIAGKVGTWGRRPRTRDIQSPVALRRQTRGGMKGCSGSHSRSTQNELVSQRTGIQGLWVCPRPSTWIDIQVQVLEKTLLPGSPSADRHRTPSLTRSPSLTFVCTATLYSPCMLSL